MGDDAVLDAAWRVVERVGPSGLTFAAVGAEAGLSGATLVQRFSSKRGLLLAMARRAEHGAAAHLRDAAARARSPLRGLVTGLARMAATVASPEVLANQLAFLQVDLGDPEFHGYAHGHAVAVRDEIERQLDAAVAAGELRPCDTRRLAQGVQTTYNGALITWGVHREGPLDRWLRRELDTLLDPRRA